MTEETQHGDLIGLDPEGEVSACPGRGDACPDLHDFVASSALALCVSEGGSGWTEVWVVLFA